MELNVPERVALLDVLSDFQGSYLSLLLIRKVREGLSFTEDEIEELGIEESPGRVTWKRSSIKDISIGEKAKGLIVEALARLDIQEKLSDRHFTLYEKFMVEVN